MSAGAGGTPGPGSGPERWFFLRGLVRETGHWSGFLEEFHRAFPEREAIGLDLPGNGHHFRETSPTSIAEMTHAVRAEFLRRRGDKNYLFAISLGAMVGMDWLSRFPGDLRGAVFGNTSVKGLSPFPHRLRPSTYPVILQILLRSDPLFRERKILSMTSRRPENFSRLEKDWVEIARKQPVSVKNAFRQILAAMRFQPPREKPAGQILLLSGARDELVNPACSERIAEHWGVPLETHAAAGHDITLDERAWVIEQVRDYF